VGQSIWADAPESDQVTSRRISGFSLHRVAAHRCAGGVAIIRGEDSKVSDSHTPNSWAKVSFRGECTAETAADHYQPGTSH